ncbi:PP2C family protein-serine/threonine phosphatase [Micromonospora mirobrigensis]|uniref:Serine phosphatase RsbU, regulator of sigma subunit n=1 Tax=Micromonospora mirobrigensis TaxID=262898 RepID=A0A1C4V5Z5_9ACTN|nr:SpoIIE family protein phosphatase [Micromonospora mirobrigensis]SCE79367.1 Serine phosphatase RsbU, regulator of sigma subunit [Micromonospora mirobrigensis]
MQGPAADRPAASLGAGRRLLAAVAVVCLALGSAGGLLAVSTYRADRAAAVEQVRLRCQAVAANVYGSRIALVRLLAAVATGQVFVDADRAAVQRRLGLLKVDDLGLTGGVTWLDRYGVTRVATRGAVDVPAGGTWWQDVVAGAEWTTSPALTSPAFTGEVVVFAVPTRGPDGRVNGVLAGGWSMSWVRERAAIQATQIGSEFYGPGTDLLVVDRAGQLIVGPGLTVTRDVHDSDAYRRLATGGPEFATGAGRVGLGLSGRSDRIAGWTRIGRFGEYVVLERSAAEAFRPAGRQLTGSLGGIVLLVSLALVSGGLAGRRIDRLTAERDRLHQAEHDAVVDLQRWLLTEDLPAGTVGRYLPAPSVLNAGGDWYDKIALGDGRHALLVGDVVGHGVKAALAMGQLRTAARALAARVAGPAALLTELDSYVAALPDVVFCTAACVVVDPSAGTLRYALAGHPPPLLRRTDGTVVRLAVTGRPLGVAGRPRVEQELAASADELLVLYTDGLVETPGEVIDAGIDRLAAAVAAEGAGGDGWTGQLITAARHGRPAGDDIALLCFRLPAAPAGARVASRAPVVVPTDPEAEGSVAD